METQADGCSSQLPGEFLKHIFLYLLDCWKYIQHMCLVLLLEIAIGIFWEDFTCAYTDLSVGIGLDIDIKIIQP